MAKVHPAFDVENKVWFVDEYQVDAPSLRELKRKLPPRTKIEGYYPNGYLRTFNYSNDILRKHFSSSLHSGGFRIGTPAAAIKTPAVRVRPAYGHTSNPDSWQGWTDENLTLLRVLFDKGLTAKPISRKLGCTRNTVIAKIHRMKWRGNPKTFANKMAARDRKIAEQKD